MLVCELTPLTNQSERSGAGGPVLGPGQSHVLFCGSSEQAGCGGGTQALNASYLLCEPVGEDACSPASGVWS